MDSSISEFIVKWAILGRVGGGSRPLRGMPLKDMLCPCPTKKKKKKKSALAIMVPLYPWEVGPRNQ
jgi:hypothetical protein